MKSNKIFCKKKGEDVNEAIAIKNKCFQDHDSDCKQCLIGLDEYEKRKALYLYQKWQIIRRNPNYVNYCKNHKFNENGLLVIKISKSQKGDKNKILKGRRNILKRFGLNMLYNPEKNITPYICYSSKLFKNPQNVNRILQPSDNDTIGRCIRSVRLPKYKHYIDIRINIGPGVKWLELQSEIEQYIQLARAARKIKIPDKKSSRFVFDENVFKVWDLRKQRKSISTVTFEIYGKRTKQLEEKVRKQYYRACELITGKSYNYENDKTWNTSQPNKSCKTCPDKPNCKTPCPGILLDKEIKTVGYNPEYLDNYDYQKAREGHRQKKSSIAQYDMPHTAPLKKLKKIK